MVLIRLFFNSLVIQVRLFPRQLLLQSDMLQKTNHNKFLFISVYRGILKTAGGFNVAFPLPQFTLLRVSDPPSSFLFMPPSVSCCLMSADSLCQGALHRGGFRTSEMFKCRCSVCSERATCILTRYHFKGSLKKKKKSLKSSLWIYTSLLL